MQLNLSEVNWRVLILIQAILPGVPVFCLLIRDHVTTDRIAFLVFFSTHIARGGPLMEVIQTLKVFTPACLHGRVINV